MMKSSKKIAIWLSLLFLAAGLLLSVCALFAIRFDFTALNTLRLETNAYTVNEHFANIYIDGAECDVRFLPSTDGGCQVICTEGDKIRHTVGVENGTLTVQRIDERKWYEHIGIYWGRMQIVVYLPAEEYGSLFVRSLSGDIELSEPFAFGEVQIENTSGNVRYTAPTKESISIKTVSGDIYVGGTSAKRCDVSSTSGDIQIASVSCDTALNARTVSGGIELSDTYTGGSTVRSTSGHIVLSNVISFGELHLESVSGDIILKKSDAASLWIKTTSGNVNGSLLTDKSFVTDTVSGYIDVPSSGSGGSCQIKTTSGNVKITIGQ